MSTRNLFTTLLLIGLFAIGLRPPLDPDMWWHLRTGEYILQNGIPTADPNFSFTMAGQPWIAHEWLTDILMVALYRVGGLPALQLGFGVIILGAFYLLYRASEGQPYTAGLITLWGAAASLPFLGARPQMINLLGSAAVIFIIEGVRRGRFDNRWLLGLPVLTVAWVNMHGGYLVGLAIVGVYVAGESLNQYLWAEHHTGLEWPAVMMLAGAGALMPLAALINPNGAAMWTYAYQTTLSSEAMQTYILEWRSPDFQLGYFWIFGTMMMAAWTAMIFSRRPVSLTDLLFIGGTTYAALSSMRNIPIFAIVAVPILCRHVVGAFEATAWYPMVSGRRPEPTPAARSRLFNGVMAIVIGLGVALYAWIEIGKIPALVAENFPVEAVDFLEANNIDRVFNEYAWGGYLIWRDYPSFIDGRADLFGDEFLTAYMRTFRTQTGWQEILDEYEIQFTLLRVESDLDTLLETAPSWQEIYRDEVAVIYQRNGS